MPERSKKRRASPAGDLDDDGSQPAHKASKTSRKTATLGASADGQDDDGNPFWELSSKRRVGLSQFKNMFLVNLREYYEQDGKMLPGRKGISLSLEQYTAFLKAVPAINETLRKMGHAIDDVDEAEKTSTAAPSKPNAEKAKPPKANIEATSDEDED